MSRDYIDDATARQRQVIALVSAGLEDLRREGGESSLHDRLSLARESAVRTLEVLEAITRSLRERSPAAGNIPPASSR